MKSTIEAYKQEQLRYANLSLMSMLAYVAILFVPTQGVIEWVTLVLLFLGLQLMLFFQTRRGTPVPTFLRQLRKEMRELAVGKRSALATQPIWEFKQP